MYKKIIIGMAVACILGVIGMVMFRPKDISLADISYEKITPQVNRIEKAKKQVLPKQKETRYYVYVEYEGEHYVWYSTTDPGLTEGKNYDFYLCQGDIYRSEEELLHNVKAQSSSLIFRVSAGAAIFCFMGFWISIYVYKKDKEAA